MALTTEEMLKLEQNIHSRSITLSKAEQEYIRNALEMPLNKIKDDLELYDNSNPKMDELIFVRDLCDKYNKDRKSILKRIRQVRRIIRLQRNNSNLEE